MADFSSVTRIVVALVLALVSFVAWRWMQTASATRSRAAAADKKKPSKKKPTKKKKKTAAADATAASASTPTAAADATAASASTPTATTTTTTTSVVVDDAAATHASDDDDSDDEDAGLTAKQILARRRFKPKAIGGHAAATRAAATAEAVSAARFHAGQRVVARFQGGPEWFPGVIHEVRRGNEYHIKYDDGEVELHVPHACIHAEEARGSPEAARDAHLDDDDDGSASSSDLEDEGGDTSEDGWHVVEKKRRAVGTGAAAADGDKVDAEGLTKRQRENRRKKERKKEVKEMARAQAQEQGLHARWGGTMTRLKYVPPPPGTAKPT